MFFTALNTVFRNRHNLRKTYVTQNVRGSYEMIFQLLYALESMFSPSKHAFHITEVWKMLFYRRIIP